ncbi:MAG: hypothetical protein IT425_09840 [Pirellulales bacterium]|nr:hypothetical protein [Pirellulales bacterium]
MKMKRILGNQLSRRKALVGVLMGLSLCGSQTVAAPPVGNRSQAGQAYLDLIENFIGFAENYWNNEADSYDAQGSGVTWARGNGGMCLGIAVLLTEYPDRKCFTSKQIPRKVLFDHLRLATRTLCLTSNVCTDLRAKKPGTWGGPDPNPRSGGWHWQAGLETEHWVLAAFMLRNQLDEDTLSLVRQVAGAEADGAANRPIHSARPGDTAADDCSWNAGILGVCAAIYSNDPRAQRWDECAKRWALNMEGREHDRTSLRMIDGRPLSEWLVSNNANPDRTIVNHGFWNLPYQTSFADLSEAIVAYKMCGRAVPEAFHAHALASGKEILQWLVTPDGDLLCPQGIDWAERDVQHSWAYTILGVMHDEPWARAAEDRCVELLTRRQATFGDGSIHALDFGYQTDLLRVWASSFLLHKYFGKPDRAAVFDEPQGAKVFPHVSAAVYRTPDLISSVSWFPNRQAIMVLPNNLKAVANRPTFTRWDVESGTGWVQLKGDKKHRRFTITSPPVIEQKNGALCVSFTREVPRHLSQEISYCGLPNGTIVVFSGWKALKDLDVVELVDHPFHWVEIDKFITRPTIQHVANTWNIDGKLQMQILGNVHGEVAEKGINGAVRRSFEASANDGLLQSVCVYQAVVRPKTPDVVRQSDNVVKVGNWSLGRDASGKTTIKGPG